MGPKKCLAIHLKYLLMFIIFWKIKFERIFGGPSPQNYYPLKFKHNNKNDFLIFFSSNHF